jgi:glycyl-tRNA synthetase
MFINFRRGYQHAREKLPFALAQVGKVMRNEISPRRGLTRVREFTIMELELFFDPQHPGCPWLGEVAEEPLSLITETMMEEENTTPIQTTVAGALQQGLILTEWQAYFMGVSQRFINHLGVPPERQRFRAHLPAERAHYSAQTYDHEVEIEGWGWTEVAGHAYRTDYDLNAHQDGSAQDMTILREDGTRVVPHVVEPSFGLDRVFLATLMTSYERRKKRNILRLPRDVAPIQAAVFPLVTKDGLPEKAQQVHRLLIDARLNAQYDDGGSVGRRYARADEAGTPLAVTIDYDTLEDETVTLRDRDTWTQVRTPISQLAERLESYLRHEAEFPDLGTPL